MKTKKPAKKNNAQSEPVQTEAIIVAQDDFGFWCGGCHARNELPFHRSRQHFAGLGSKCVDCGCQHFVDGQLIYCER